MASSRHDYNPEDQWSCKRSPEIWCMFDHYGNVYAPGQGQMNHRGQFYFQNLFLEIFLFNDILTVYSVYAAYAT